jgi:hypothetical protein
MNGATPKAKPYEFPGFPRLEGEDGGDYIERYTQHQTGGYRPARPVLVPPKEEPQTPYKEPREVGEEG